MRYCRWGRLFYLSLLLLGTSCWYDWCVTTLVPFDSLFNLLYISCLFVTRVLKNLCVVAAETVSFLFRPCEFSVLRVGLIAALRRWYLTGSIFTLYAFLVSSWRAARCCDAALPSILPFSLFSSWKFVQSGSLWRCRCYWQFSPFLLLSSFYFVKRWPVRRCRCYRQFSLLFSCKFVSTIETY